MYRNKHHVNCNGCFILRSFILAGCVANQQLYLKSLFVMCSPSFPFCETRNKDTYVIMHLSDFNKSGVFAGTWDTEKRLRICLQCCMHRKDIDSQHICSFFRYLITFFLKTWRDRTFISVDFRLFQWQTIELVKKFLRNLVFHLGILSLKIFIRFFFVLVFIKKVVEVEIDYIVLHFENEN